jgi:zinc-binding alcohol dehydrogenase family protein
MKAVGYTMLGEIDREDSLVDFEMERPHAEAHDLLVAVRAVAVNPVDYKVRNRRPPEGDQPNVLGYDAVGEVVETGADATLFKPGDQVWYAGVINRSGTNAEFHLVDERIVGRAPEGVPDAEAAALPLTTLTAYEMLFDRLRVTDPVPSAAPAVLIIGGAGGVGSIAIQLLRAKTDLDVIATASRPETEAWVRELGAHHVVNHHDPLAPQIEALGIGAPGFVFSTTHTHVYLEQVAELIAPQGRFGLIDDPDTLNVMPFKTKAVSTHWELMFTRPLFETADMARQGDILTEVAGLIENRQIQSTATEAFGTICAANLRLAHQKLASGTARGKVVHEGF